MIAPPNIRGAWLWIYDGKEARQTWDRTRATTLRVRPSGVILHTEPDPEDGAVVDAIRRDTGGPVVVATGINGLVASRNPDGTLTPRAVDDVRRQVGVWASRCAAWGTPWILNAEGASAPGRPGWKPRQPLSRAELSALAKAVMDAALNAAPSLVIGYSGHDVPDSHAVPHDEFCAGASFLLPQEYTSPGDGTVADARYAMMRAALGEPQWRARVAAGRIAERLAPGGDGWWPAYQLHHTEAHVLVRIALRYARSAWWAHPSSFDAAGLEALATVAALHRAGLPLDVRELQRALGVDDDGVFGRETYAALRRRLAL